MSKMRIARWAFMAITVVSIGAALFRVATAPDRVRDRRLLAQQVCINGGGEWALVDRAEVCRKADGEVLPWQRVEGRKSE